MQKLRRMKSLGFSLIYPKGCKELSESLKVDELRRRLNDLISSFDKISEEEACNGDSTFDVDNSTCNPPHDNLKGLFLLLISEYIHHPDRDIQFRVGVCVCKLLKIFCPHNPFSGISEEKSLTKDTLIFLLNCISQLVSVKSKGDVLYPKMHTILYICCQIDLFLWCAALEDETVLFECIKTTFTIIKNLSTWAWTDISVIRQMLLDMIVKVIVQAESLISNEMIHFLLELLIEPAKSTQPEQHMLARDLILRSARHLEYGIQMLLQNALLAGIEEKSEVPQVAPKPTEVTSEGEHDSDNAEVNEEVKVAPRNVLGEHSFLIIYALHTLQDSIIAPVLPTIELKLKSPSGRDRKRSVRLLARLFSEPNSLLHEKNPGLWDAFLGRFNDIEKEVRKLCIHMTPQLLKQNPDLPKERLLSCVRHRAHDPDEDVRLLVLRTVAALIHDTPDVSDELFDLLKERSRDKSVSIRKEASNALANVYKHLLKDGTPRENDLCSCVNTILHMYYHPSLDDRIVVERIFKSTLVPYHFKTVDRVRAWFTCYGLMDEASARAMQEMFKVQYTASTLLRDVLMLLGSQESKKIPKKLDTDLMDRLHHLANLIAKSDKAVEHLKRFFNQTHTDKSLRTQLVKLTRPSCTCAQATNTMRDVLKRIENPAGGAANNSEAHINYVRSVKILLERSAPVLFDKEFGQELVMQLVVIRETGSIPGILGPMTITHALRLVHAMAVYFKKILPTDEVMDYLVGVLTSESSQTSADLIPLTALTPSDVGVQLTVEQDPLTVNELALNILCCLLGGQSTVMVESEIVGQHRLGGRASDTHFNGSESNFTERVYDFLPMLKRFCCTGMTKLVPPVPYRTADANRNLPATARVAKGKTGRGATARQDATPPSDIQANAVQKAGLAWRQERRRAKLSTRVLFCMLRVAQRLRQTASRSRLIARNGVDEMAGMATAEDVDLDADDDAIMRAEEEEEKNAQLDIPSSLENDIQVALDEIVQVCLACSPDSTDYVTCLTTLSCVALRLPGLYNRDFKKFMTKTLVQHVLVRTGADDASDAATADESPEKLDFGSEDSTPQATTSQTTVRASAKSAKTGTSSKLIVRTSSSADWLADGHISQATRAKICAVKLMTNWLRGLKNEMKPVAQAVIRLLHQIIIHEGDLTRQGKLLSGEMSRMRLVAAVSWLKLAHSQSYVENIEVDWYQSMTYIICDPCPQVRSHFLTKLNQGLSRLRLPLEYMAMFAHATDVSEAAYRQRAKQLLISNIQRRRDFLNRHPSYLNDPKFLFALLPDFVLPYLVYLLAHDPEWSDVNDINRLGRIKASLWFVMEPIVSRGHSFIFLRKIIEKIKHTRDALAPDDTTANTKLYIVCDIALGLLLTRSSDLSIKEYPVEIRLPKTLFLAAPADFKNPDFAQLLDPALGTHATLVAESAEGGNANEATKPLMQFTPCKGARNVKHDLMPAGLLKDKRNANAANKVSQPESPTNGSSEPQEKVKLSKPTHTKQSKLGWRSKAASKRTAINSKNAEATIESETLEEEVIVVLDNSEESTPGTEATPSSLQNTPKKFTRIVLGKPEIESDNTNSPVGQRKRVRSSPVTPSKRRRLFSPAETKVVDEEPDTPPTVEPKKKATIRVAKKTLIPQKKLSGLSKAQTTTKAGPSRRSNKTNSEPVVLEKSPKPQENSTPPPVERELIVSLLRSPMEKAVGIKKKKNGSRPSKSPKVPAVKTNGTMVKNGRKMFSPSSATSNSQSSTSTRASKRLR